MMSMNSWIYTQLFVDDTLALDGSSERGFVSNADPSAVGLWSTEPMPVVTIPNRGETAGSIIARAVG